MAPPVVKRRKGPWVGSGRVWVSFGVDCPPSSVNFLEINVPRKKGNFRERAMSMVLDQVPGSGQASRPGLVACSVQFPREQPRSQSEVKCKGK